MSERAVTIMLADGHSVGITPHALQRYNERACPALDLEQARRHLVRLALQVGRLDGRPDWVRYHNDERAVFWVTLGPDIALVIDDGWALTALTRGCLNNGQILARRRRRRARRAAAHYKQRQSKAERRLARSKRRNQDSSMNEAA